jgi:hypothetical protein
VVSFGTALQQRDEIAGWDPFQIVLLKQHALL